MNILYNIIIFPIEMIFDAIFSYLQDFPGIAIIAISIVMNLLALPLYRRADEIQEEESKKVTSMSKWVNHIKKTFSGDERYMMLTEYYRQENYKPIYSLRSIFPLLLQIPFFIAAYHYLSHQTMLSGAPFLFLKDLGVPDGLLRIGSMTINVLPIAMTALNLVSAYIYLRVAPLKNKIQTYGIALIFLVLLYNSPSGLVFYWTLNQVFSVAKNVFMKLIKSRRTQSVVLAAIGMIAVISLALLGFLGTRNRKLIATGILLVTFSPAILSYIKSKRKGKIKKIVSIKTSYFFLGTVFLTIFVGTMIPLSVINSDPSEFVSNVITPASLVVNNISIYAGFFIFWLGIYYSFLETAIRNAFTIVIWLLSGMFLVNYLFFAGDYGIMSNSFVFDNTPTFPKSEILLNLIVVIAVMAILFLVIRKWKKVIPYVYSVLIVACVSISLVYCTHITKMLATPDKKATIESIENDTSVNTLKLSKTAKNVVVFVIDMAEGAYVPFIFEEKPELKEQFSGFTFYPNTLSYGSVTKWGAPGLYGGHDYSPFALNERSDELLVDKHDEALAVMPAVFSDNGYDVTVWGTVLAGYGDPQKATSVYDFDSRIKEYRLDEKYFDDIYKKYGASIGINRQTNLAFYSLLSISPTVLRKQIYNNGNYLHTSHIIYSELFLTTYCSLLALPEITDTADDQTGSFLMLYNSLPHQFAVLEAPEYEPKEDAVPSLEISKKERIFGDKTLSMQTVLQISTYDSNVATYILLGKWLEYLKKMMYMITQRLLLRVTME